jgi:hypothetical protein
VDAMAKGNATRRINHDADAPNISSMVVNHYGVRKVCMYAKIDIPRDTELTFDYGRTFYHSSKRPTVCRPHVYSLAQQQTDERQRLDDIVTHAREQIADETRVQLVVAVFDVRAARFRDRHHQWLLALTEIVTVDEQIEDSAGAIVQAGEYAFVGDFLEPAPHMQSCADTRHWIRGSNNGAHRMSAAGLLKADVGEDLLVDRTHRQPVFVVTDALQVALDSFRSHGARMRDGLQGSSS